MATSQLPLAYSQPVARARAADLPLVALESTVITHGLPFPENLNLLKTYGCPTMALLNWAINSSKWT